MNNVELKDFLDEKSLLYNHPDFILNDPIQVPHNYTLKEDIEIAAFLSTTIAWGNRTMIIKNAKRMMELMGNSPYDFVLNHKEHHLDNFNTFVHRTFNSDDFKGFIMGLQHIYLNHQGLENVFSNSKLPLQDRISDFKKVFFEANQLPRTHKHVSDPRKGSAAKRLNMFLRWMVRNDQRGVDFGIWKAISPSELSCPLDVHSGNVARKLGILTRKQNDAKALAELDEALRVFDPIDPTKYDFALFGLGAIEKF